MEEDGSYTENVKPVNEGRDIQMNQEEFLHLINIQISNTTTIYRN